MEKLRKFVDFLTNPETRVSVLQARGFYDNLTDEQFIRKKWKSKMDYPLNLDNPQTLCEKLQWLKLHDRKPKYSAMVDKYEAKKIVADAIGERYIIPTYGVWDDFDSIDFDALPEQFVLKCTHDSGGFVICKDKKTFDKEAAKKKLCKSLKRNYYYGVREWPYKDVKPRIIAEKYIKELGHPDSIEYKTTCFNGKVKFVTICTGIAHAKFEERSNDSYTTDFEHMPWYAYYKNSSVKLEKPKEWEELISVCEKLSVGVPYLRVDCYIIDGQILFGEMTFYTWGGMMKIEPSEWDRKLGEMLELPSL